MEPEKPTGSRIVLGGLCRLAQHVGDAEFTAIYVKKGGGVRVLASAGLALGALSEEWWVPVNPDRQPVVAVPDIKRDPIFADHPVHSLPGLKSVMMFPFRLPGPEGLGGLGLANLREDSFGDFRVTCALSQISWLASMTLGSGRDAASDDKTRPVERVGLEEAEAALVGGKELEPASAFLFSTLVKRPSVRTRNGVSYLTLRTWRAPIKEHQLSALRAVKGDPPSTLVMAVGEELAEGMGALHGVGRVENVVPVPCGNSGRCECLSTRIAANLATRLGARYVRALAAQSGQGRSHPRKSASLRAFDVVERPAGATLVVDDVASSGRHLELAVQALRSSNTSVLAIAWIGR